MKFEITFTGRKVGAIGITYPIMVTREAKNKEDAYSEFINWAYRYYEHISHVSVEPAKT